MPAGSRRSQEATSPIAKSGLVQGTADSQTGEDSTMRTFARLGLAAGLVAVTGLAVARPAHAAGTAATCSAGLTISTTSLGTVTTLGPIVHFSNSGVGGQYTSGVVAGYTFSGAQDITLNTATKRAELHGSHTATGSA